MITNLVSTITQSLSPDVSGRIAASLGSDRAAVEKGIGASVPGILAGLANSASRPTGGQRLGSVVSQIHGMPPQEIVKHLLDADHRKLAEPGWLMLSSLAGGGFIQALGSSIAQFSGLGQPAAKDLLGLLAPVVLEFLRREQIAKGLDSKGLAGLLASQRDNIRRALPAEMTQYLGGGCQARSGSAPQAGVSGGAPSVRDLGALAAPGAFACRLGALSFAGGRTEARFLLRQKQHNDSRQDQLGKSRHPVALRGAKGRKQHRDAIRRRRAAPVPSQHRGSGWAAPTWHPDAFERAEKEQNP